MEGSSEEYEECGEPYGTTSGYCDNKGKYPDGKCGYHTDEKDPELHGNTEHGFYVSEYYESQPKEDKEFIDLVADDLLDKSYYTNEDESMVEKCRQIAIDLHQKRRADGYIAKKGLTEENTVGFHEQYGEITETEENKLFITKDRLSRESRLAMKDLGIMDQEKTNDTGSSSSLVESLSEVVE